MDFSFQIARVVVEEPPGRRLYLCIPHERYGYVCYPRARITQGELLRNKGAYSSVSRWYPRVLHSMVLEWNLDSSVRVIRPKRN
jgi:hypothetical protein